MLLGAALMTWTKNKCCTYFQESGITIIFGQYTTKWKSKQQTFSKNGPIVKMFFNKVNIWKEVSDEFYSFRMNFSLSLSNYQPFFLIFKFKRKNIKTKPK